MTPSFEETRQTIIAAAKTMLDANFASTVVEWPNYPAANKEHLVYPFIRVLLEFSTAVEQFGISDDDSIIRGKLVFYYLYQENTGLNGVGAFLDAVKNYFCFKALSGVSYGKMVVYNVYPSPGLVGQKIEVRFMV